MKVYIEHISLYHFDTAVTLSPHLIRLHPAPNAIPVIHSYQLDCIPSKAHLTYFFDVYGNKLSKIVFSEPVRKLQIKVNIEAELLPVNLFDFFLDERTFSLPFVYESALGFELAPFLYSEEADLLPTWLSAKFSNTFGDIVSTVIAINKLVYTNIIYTERIEQGVLTPSETIRLGKGSCRDFAWLLVQLYRVCGFASRFVSGYLIDLNLANSKKDKLELHAWVEVYLPGAGWLGLDPTSGLVVNEYYLSLCASPHYSNTAPVEGKKSVSSTECYFEGSVTRKE